MVEFVKAIAEADADYRGNKASWTADSAQVKAIAKWRRKAGGRAGAVALYSFPTLEEQASRLARRRRRRRGQGADRHRGVPQGAGAGAGGLADYSRFVTTTYVEAAMAQVAAACAGRAAAPARRLHAMLDIRDLTVDYPARQRRAGPGAGARRPDDERRRLRRRARRVGLRQDHAAQLHRRLPAADRRASPARRPAGRRARAPTAAWCSRSTR